MQMKVKSGMRLGVAALSVFLIALFAHWMLWGYWISRPSVSSLLTDAAGLKGASLFEVADGRVVRVLLEGRDALDAAKWDALAVPSYGFADLLGRATALATAKEFSLGSVDRSRVEAIWSDLGAPNHRWYEVKPSFQLSAGRGWLFIIDAALDGRQTFLAAHRTSEIANDRYSYEEVAFDTSEHGLQRLRSVHYFFEIAGLEFLGLPALLVLSAILVGVVSLILLLCTRGWRRKPPGRPATANRLG